MSLIFSSQLYTTLTGNSELMDKVNYVGDTPNQQKTPPYITIEAENSTEGRLLNQTETQHSITISVWSAYHGRAEVKEIAAIVRFILENELDMLLLEAQIVKDYDTDWWRAILQYRTYLR
ncbi:MAG: DUF3168 domain-containing protein [Synergistales bacterium]|nr:DUF3168 domain-containing protein [Synergistales bacterium]